jgi:transmembrane sensor
MMNASQLDRWLDESTAHRVSFLRLQAALRRADRLQAERTRFPAGVVPEPGSWDVGARRKPPTQSFRSGNGWAKHWTSRFSIAASLALVLIGSIYLMGIQSWGEERYTTHIGGLETVTLADGSSVNLNTNTQIRVSLRKTARLISLDSGEAYFAVAEDQSRPFVVHVAENSLTAVGTAFSVRRSTESDIQILVTRGEVQLRLVNKSRPDDVTAVRAGMTARVHSDEVLVSEASDAEIQRLLSWRNGFVIFHDTPLPEAVAELNRYASRKLVIADESLNQIRIGGKFRSNNTQTFLSLLQDGFPVVAERSEDQILLRRRK